MIFTTFRTSIRNSRTGAILAATAVLGGCLQTIPVGGTLQHQQRQQQVWVARLDYSCANGSTLYVTRTPGSTSAQVRVDGRSYQLQRDPNVTGGGEYYTAPLMTLTLLAHTARFVGVGMTPYEQCTSNSMPVLLDLIDAPRTRRGSQD